MSRDVATKLYYCPECRIRWQHPYDFYAWKIGGDAEKLCPVCELQHQIDAIPDGIPATDERFELKFSLIRRQNRIKRMGEYERNINES